jgi:flagellar biosynthesis GTPase FlhF
MYEKELSKGTYSNNNINKNYVDNDSNNLKTDNFNDKILYPYLDNNKSTNNIIPIQQSLSKEDSENFNLKDYAKSIKQLYNNQINNQELDERKQLLKDQKYYYEDFSKEEGIDNNNIEYKKIFLIPQ